MTHITLPLSLSQREVWRDQCAWPGSVHLMIGGGGCLAGPFDIARCKQALLLLVAESDALRLAPLADGSQNLLTAFEPTLELVDIGTSVEPAQAMQAWWQRAVSRPFALDGTPPWRFAVLRAHPHLHGLVMQFHHLVMDGWGTSQVMKRWSELYNALESGHPPVLRGGPTYRQFIEESNLYARSEAFGRDAIFWKKQIAELPPAALGRRTSDSRQPGLALAHTVVQRIRRADYDRLAAQATRQGVTPFNFFLAALALYFTRIHNQPSVMIGVPTLNRSGRRYRQTPGMFVGVLALNIQVDPGMPVAMAVAAARASTRSGLRHPRYPLSELGRALEVVRHGRDGLFDVLLSFEQQDYDVAFGAAKRVNSHQFFSGISRYPLGVTVCEFHPEQDLELVLEGSRACFAEGEVELLGHRLWFIAQQLASEAQTLARDLEILPPSEREQLLAQHPEAGSHHGATRPFITCFEQHAARQPQATSLVWDGGHMDYRTLDAAGDQLAHRLVAIGAGRDRIVAVAIARSPNLVVAMLAIAKAGSAYLPLDPDAPIARLAGILEESSAVALLIEDESWERLAHLHARTVVTRWQETPADQAALEPLVGPAPGDLAYVLFTSGSTGRPKGVMVEHTTLSRRLAWLSRVYGVDASDRSVLATQATFDPSLIELCLPLMHGGSIALAPAGRLHPALVAEFAIRHSATIMAFVPSTLSGFLDAVGDRLDLKLRVACCGGEVLSPELARRYLTSTRARLFNVYGPTEACIFATAWECRLPIDMATLPIGAPIDDTSIYVLDPQLRHLPLGAVGEIFIGGDTLARGYLDRPELTDASFVPDPFRPGKRMYRSGDRGWLAPDAQLHFVGRVDRQIKLRGYRIELGEIEAAMLALEGVTQAAVKLVERNGRPVIHAWVAAGSGNGVDALQRALGVRLPDYMIPGAIHVLPSLATGSAGKTDYEALPAIPDAPPRVRARDPGSPLERDLLALWQDVLERRPLTVHDNFFDVGGDSLSAMNILTGVERLVGHKVPLYLLTEHPTVERLVLALDATIAQPELMVDFGPPTSHIPLYLAASGHGDLMRFQTLAKALDGVCDLHMLQPPAAEPVKRIVDLAALYADTIQAHGKVPAFIAGFSVGGIAALETARLLKQRGAPVRGLILIDTVYPKAVWGGTLYWRLFSWLVRNLRIQDLSINGRRLGAMVRDPGLVGQVMAMSGYRASAFAGSTVLIKTAGLARWDRALFGSWRKLMGPRLVERGIAGLHGSIFESANVGELASVLASIVADPE
ncbi:MAG: amino acid adenylation domain-containing protein [Rhodoferax sp.]|nr:amino acid adenylation domain-containing protein [Rhodoferax sp.]